MYGTPLPTCSLEAGVCMSFDIIYSGVPQINWKSIKYFSIYFRPIPHNRNKRYVFSFCLFFLFFFPFIFFFDMYVNRQVRTNTKRQQYTCYIYICKYEQQQTTIYIYKHIYKYEHKQITILSTNIFLVFVFYSFFSFFVFFFREYNIYTIYTLCTVPTKKQV